MPAPSVAHVVPRAAREAAAGPSSQGMEARFGFVTDGGCPCGRIFGSLCDGWMGRRAAGCQTRTRYRYPRARKRTTLGRVPIDARVNPSSPSALLAGLPRGWQAGTQGPPGCQQLGFPDEWATPPLFLVLVYPATLALVKENTKTKTRAGLLRSGPRRSSLSSGCQPTL